MFFVVFGLLFVAFAGLLIITALRIEANSRVLQENTRVLLRLEEKFAPDSEPDSEHEREVILPPKPSERGDAEIQAIPRRPQSDTLISGSEPPPPRDTTPDAPRADDLLDGGDEDPTTVLPQCGKCGSIDYVATGGLFKCNSCKKVGHLSFPGLHQRKVA